MQVILHTGAHFTDSERLMKSLLKNKGTFLKQGVAVPGPGKYRRLLRRSLTETRQGAADVNTRKNLVDAFLDGAQADRVILSNANFFSADRASVRQGMFYPKAVEWLLHFQSLFPDDEIEIYMGLRDPASFLSAAFEVSSMDIMDTYLQGHDPRKFLWSNTISQILEQVPKISIKVWCNEDTPLIWGEIIRDMAGLELHAEIEGGFDLLAEIMSKEGMSRFEDYLASHPTLTEIQCRRVIAAFLDKFALDEAIEEELDVPGWTEAFINELTEIYEDDVFAIARMPRVQLIAP